MGKKKQHHEEHENHERWLVSYADFITLLFATFVVLYALSQADVAAFSKLEDSMKKAFAAPSLVQGADSILTNSGNNLISQESGETAIPPILEYLNSAKFEETNFNQAKKELEDLEVTGKIDNTEVTVDERGLVINIYDLNLFFNSGSAKLNPNSNKTIDKIAMIILKKFPKHLIRIEGYTDDQAISNDVYPSNWELSSARAATVLRYMITRFKFDATKFAAIGYAETKPIASNKTAEGRLKNRRVSIVILRNKFSASEPRTIKSNNVNNISNINKVNSAVNVNKIEKPEKPKIQTSHTDNANSALSDAARKLLEESGQSSGNVLILSDRYEGTAKKLAEELKQTEIERKKRYHLQN